MSREGSLEIKDTYPDFLAYWDEAAGLPVEGKLEKWRTEYMEKYPSLLNKQLEDYENEGFDWRRAAMARVFPHLEERLPEMSRGRRNLREKLPEVHEKARNFFAPGPRVTAVIYVGIGCGAGWSTKLEGELALLFGLENVAECGWADERSLEGLVAHELGHLFHGMSRRDSNLTYDRGPLWRLYKEGVAKWSEFNLLNRRSWYEAEGLNEPGWLDWCREKRGWLAGEFLRTIERGGSADRFFGSWYEVEGWKQTGYFLGYEVVANLISDHDLTQQELLKIRNPSGKMKQALEELAGS